MTMQSTNLLPALRELPGGDESSQNRSFRDNITGVVSMDRAMYAAEFAAGVSFGLWGVFDSTVVADIQIPDAMPADAIQLDEIFQLAYEIRWPNIAAETPLMEDKWQLLRESGESTGWFEDGLGGQLAEFNAMAVREHMGQSGVRLAEAANNRGWDFSYTSEGGATILEQVKHGPSHSFSSFRDNMTEHPDVTQWWVGQDAYDDAVRASESLSDGVQRTIHINNDVGLKVLVNEALTDSSFDNGLYPFDVGSQIDGLLDGEISYSHIEGTADGLSTLSEGMGIDVPDGVVDIVPYAGAIIAGARLVHSVLQTEKEFKAADRTTRNKVQVVQTLTLMSRMGITTTLATVGGMGGGALGSGVPGAGNLVGGIGGSLVGAGVGMYLNRHLQPHMLNLALNITGLTSDDLFYYKNKPRIDDVTISYQAQARALTAPA